MTEQVLLGRLLVRYCQPEWAFLPKVRNKTGFSAEKARYIDGMAMNLYPSRGHEVHGFECKSHRSDWLKELSDPDKADELLGYCDRWWIVIGRTDLVKPDELPKTWGLLAPRGEGLVVKKQAPELKPKLELDRGFVASMIRRAMEHILPETEWEDKVSKSWQEGYETGKQKNERLIKRHKERADEAQKIVYDFQDLTGLQINEWNLGRIAEAVKIIQNAKTMDQIVEATEDSLKRITGLHKSLERGLFALKKVQEKHHGKSSGGDPASPDQAG